MTNFPTILNRLTGMFSEDRADFIASFDEYDLLIMEYWDKQLGDYYGTTSAEAGDILVINSLR